jgi:class 3 adenylate cyclase
MSLGVGAKTVRADLYTAIASVVQDPGAVPLAEALATVERCLEAGECLLASDACERLAPLFPEDPKLIQLWALALARSGATNKANALMVSLAARGFNDEETLGLLARTYKDLWAQTGDRKRLSRARETYLRATELTKGAWTGINAATLAAVDGDDAEAARLAKEVLQSLAPLLVEYADEAKVGLPDEKKSFSALARVADPEGAPGTDRAHAYWNYATVGEAAVILGRHDLASWAYKKAVRVSDGQLGNRASTLRNAEVVLSVRGAARRYVEDKFPKPQVVVFAGHMLDAPDRGETRFQPAQERAVYSRILAAVSGWDTQIGFSSAAGGSDILFLEAMKEIGAETNIVLPYPPVAFVKTSVVEAGGTKWASRFEKVLADARHVTILSDSPGDAVGHYFNGIVMAGLARLRASQVCGNLRGLVVWDLEPGLVGGTGHTVSEWLRRGFRMSRLSPAGDDGALHDLAPTQRSDAASLGPSRQRVVSMLFADAVGFSKLTEEQIPTFVEHFLGGVREVMNRQEHPPLTCNTWGDGLYFAFDSVMDANEFALDLSDLVNLAAWKAHGLPPDLNLRIALHAGPAFEILDPVTQQRGFTGTHVSRAARIEPVTPPGYVYCSESHAALVALEGDDSYTCEFVGNMPYAKNYGVFPMYSLKRRRAVQWSKV